MKARLIVAGVLVALGPADLGWARKWSDKTGSYTVEAELVKVEDGQVHLEKPDGQIIQVPWERLSAADQRFLESPAQPATPTERPAPAKKPASATKPRPGKNLPLKIGRTAILQELGRRTRYNFADRPLRDVLAQLEEMHQIPIFLDQRALAEQRLLADAPVTAKADSDTLDKSLTALLKPLGLTWLIRDEVLFVTTPDRAQQRLDARLYRVVGPKQNLAALARQITAEVVPQSWNNSGGAGQIHIWPLGAVVISQTDAVHRQVEQRFTKTLQPLLQAEAKTTRRPARSRPTIKDALGQPSSCEFSATPLKVVARTLAEQNKIRVLFDEKALQAAGIDLDTPVTCRLRGLKLESELALLLEQLKLTWTIRDDQLVLTTAEAEAARLLTLEYDVRGLVFANDGDNEPILRMLQTCVAPLSWSLAGGPGTVKTAEDGGALEIKQTFRHHVEIDRLLNDLRDF